MMFCGMLPFDGRHADGVRPGGLADVVKGFCSVCLGGGLAVSHHLEPSPWARGPALRRRGAPLKVSTLKLFRRLAKKPTTLRPSCRAQFSLNCVTCGRIWPTELISKLIQEALVDQLRHEIVATASATGVHFRAVFRLGRRRLPRPPPE